MKLSEFKNYISNTESINFILENGIRIPSHFHLTEVGELEKKYIDCGGTIRREKKINFQLWLSDDVDHRITTEKLLRIIAISEEKLNIGDFEVEVEYQNVTIGKYNLDFVSGEFILQNQKTDCLAKDNCDIPTEKPRIRISTEPYKEPYCTPGSGCC